MIKFRYVYSNGKEIKSFIYTIEEIEVSSVYGTYKGMDLISRDKHTGLEDKNGVEIYENDVVAHKYGFGNGTSNVSQYGKMWKLVSENCTCEDIDFDECEIISNTHIEGIKNDR